MMKKFKCPYCGDKHEKNDLVSHIEEDHDSQIPKDFSGSRIVFNIVNKKDHGTCVVCKKPTKWNETAGKYDRLCGNPKCRKTLREKALSNMIKVYNKPTLLDDMGHQSKMLANRKISGKYRFQDGGSHTYTGTYEQKALEFFDKVLNVKSVDIMTPGPVLEYDNDGKKLKWITDIFYIPYNLIIEVKDGGSNPNNRNMEVYRDKQIEKEKMITELGTYNYLRLTNNNFLQIMEIFSELKQQMIDDSNENKRSIIKINEMDAPGGMPVGVNTPNANAGYVISYSYKNTFTDEVEGFALTDDLFDNDIIVSKNGELRIESFDFLNERKLAIYKYKGNRDKVKKIIKECKEEFNRLSLPIDTRNEDILTLAINDKLISFDRDNINKAFDLLILRDNDIPVQLINNIEATKIIDNHIKNHDTYKFIQFNKMKKSALIGHGEQTEVYAIADGTIVYTEKSISDNMYNALGINRNDKFIIIKHDKYTYSIYTNATFIKNIDIGATVKKFDIIATVMNKKELSNFTFDLVTLVGGKEYRQFESLWCYEYKSDIMQKGFTLNDKILSEKLFNQSMTPIPYNDTSYTKYTLPNIGIISKDPDKINNYVLDNIYTILTGKELMSPDQIEFDPDFGLIELDKIKIKTESAIATMNQEFNLINNMNKNTYLPILNRVDASIAESKLYGTKNLTILEDCDGYFVHNLNTKERGKSYKNINDVII